MQYDKKRYEQLISDSPLFSLDKETEYAAFKRESYRMVELLYCYLLSVNEREYEPYGYEITEVATRCIRNYDSRKGVFLHYFNSAWRQEYSHILGEQAQEDKYRGIRITDDDKRAVQKYIRLSNQLEMEHNPKQLYTKLSAAMDLPVEKIMELAKLNSINVCGDRYISDNGEERSIWDLLPGDENVLSPFENEEGISSVLGKIDKAFATLQERQKPIVSDMITIRICPFLSESDRMVHPFVSKSVMDDWLRYGTIPTQRDIANKYGRDEASISRTMKTFLEKLKKEN